MSIIDRYPNPLRLFSKQRDIWFMDKLAELHIPVQLYTAIRDSQLGQLVFSIESLRIKRERAGEEPGPSFLAESTAEAFIPLLSYMKQLNDFLAKDEVGLEFADFAAAFESKEFTALEKADKTAAEWFLSLSYDRLDELYQADATFMLEQFLPIIDNKLEGEEQVVDKIKGIDETLGSVFQGLIDLHVYDAISNATFNVLDDEQQSREYPGETDPIVLSYAEYHARVNALHSFILELHRKHEQGTDYSISLTGMEPILTLEMLIMSPYPDKDRITVVKDHVKTLAETTSMTPEFLSILSESYQVYTRLSEPITRLTSKMVSSAETALKHLFRDYWAHTLNHLINEADEYQKQVAVLWAHYRVLQAQAENVAKRKGQDVNRDPAYRQMVRLENMFWNQGKAYLSHDPVSATHFWAIYASIAARLVRSQKESAMQYTELDQFVTATKALKTKKAATQFGILLVDKYSILQRLLSYGFEGRSKEMEKGLKKYVDTLEKVVEDAKEQELDYFDIEQETKAIADMRTYLDMELPDINEIQTSKKPSRRR